MMGGDDSPPPAPDYSPFIQLSQEQADRALALQERQFDLWSSRFDENSELAQIVTESDLEMQDMLHEWAMEDRAFYEDEVMPRQAEWMREADDYASEDRQNYEAGKAAADYEQNAEQRRKANLDVLAANGVDPSQMQSGALDLQSRIAGAAGATAAAQGAREQTEATGREMRLAGLNLGKGFPAQALGASQGSGAAGTQGANVTYAGTQLGANTTGTPMQYNAAALGWGNMGANTMSDMYKNQLKAYELEQKNDSGFGSALGAGMSLASKFMPIPFAQGGPVPEEMAIGGVDPGPPGANVDPMMSPSDGAAIDDIPARLNAGEFVFPRDVMQWKGEQWAQKEIMKARKEMQGGDGERPARPEMGPTPPQAPGQPVLDTDEAI